MKWKLWKLKWDQQRGIAMNRQAAKVAEVKMIPAQTSAAVTPQNADKNMGLG
jgi:hypothetical protein